MIIEQSEENSTMITRKKREDITVILAKLIANHFVFVKQNLDIKVIFVQSLLLLLINSSHNNANNKAGYCFLFLPPK